MDSAQVLDINDPNVEAFADFDPDETEFVYNTPAQYEEIFMKNNINHNEVSLFNIWQTIHKFFDNIMHSPNIIPIDRDTFSQNMKIYELLCDKLDLFASVKDSVYTTLRELTLKSMDCFDDFYFDKFLAEFEKHRTIFNKQVQIVNHYHRVSKHPPQVFTEEYPIFQKQKRIMAALMSFLKDKMLLRSCNRIIKKIQKLRELFVLIIETSPTDADKLKEAVTNAFDNIITLVLDLKGMLLGRQLLHMSMQFIPPSKIEAQKRSFLNKDEILRQQIENEKTYKQMIESRGTERIAQQNSEDLKDSTNLFNLILSLDSNSELIQNAIEMLKKGIENKDIVQDVSKQSFISAQENLRKFLRSISLVLPKVEFHDAKYNLGLISAAQNNDKSEIINKLIQSIDQLSGRIMKTSQISQVMINLRAIKDFEECKEIYEKFNNYFFHLYHIIEVIEMTNDSLRSKISPEDFSPLYLDFDNLNVDNIPQEFITKFNDCCNYLKNNSLDISLTDNFQFDNLIIPNIHPVLKEISEMINKLPHNTDFAFAHKFNENIFEKSEKFQIYFQTEVEMMKIMNTTNDYPCLNEIISKLALFRYLDTIFFMLDIIRKVPYEISVQNTYLRLNYIINDQCDHLKNNILIKPLNPKHLQEIFYKQGLLKLVFFMKMYWPHFLDHNIENSIKIFKMFIKALQDKQFDGLMPLFDYISSQNSTEIQPAEDILQLSFILLNISTSINYKNGVINSSFTNLSSHGFIEYFYNFNVQNYDSIFDPLSELIDSLNSPRLTHKLASLRYGSSSTQSLVELALYVISDPKLTVNLKEFKEKLLPLTSFITNFEGIDFVANLVCSQLQTTLMKPYAVASFNVPRFSFMFSDLILYLNTVGIIPTSESYTAIQYSLLLKNIHPPNLILGNDIKKMLQNIRETSSFVSKYCNKSNPAIQTLFSRLKATIQLTLKSTELPLAFLSTIHEKLFSGESVTEDSYLLLSYFDENDPIFSNIKAFFDILYVQADLELIYSRILPELIDVEYSSLLSSLFLMFTDECYCKLCNNQETKEEGKNRFFSAAAGAILEAMNSDTESGLICAGKAYACFMDLENNYINELIPFEQLLDKIPYGKNDNLNELFIMMQSYGIRTNLLQPTEEMINNIFQLFLVDNENYHQIAELALENISFLQDPELHAIIWDFLSKCLSSDECSSDFILSTFDVMKNVSKNLNPTICESIFPDLAQLHEVLLSSNETGQYISKYLGILANVMSNIGKDHAELGEQTLEIISKFIDGYEEDCMYSFNILIKTFGHASPEILQCCFNFIKERIGEIDNFEQNSEANELFGTIIDVIDDEELLFDIAQYIIQHADMFEDLLYQFGHNLGYGLLTIYRKIPQKFSELLEQVRENIFLELLATNSMFENIPMEKREYALNALIDLIEESQAEVSIGEYDIQYLTEQFPNYAERIKNCFKCYDIEGSPNNNESFE